MKVLVSPFYFIYSSYPSDFLCTAPFHPFPYTRNHPGLFTLRHKMWEAIAGRSHHPIKIFPFGEINESAAEAEVMLYGTVDYKFKAGGGERKEWAARVEMVRDGEGEWKMRLYQVYLVSVVFFPLCFL